MLKPYRPFIAVFVFLLLLAAVPLSQSNRLKGFLLSVLGTPLTFAKDVSKTATELIQFRHIARENRALKEKLAEIRFNEIQMEELRLENERLVKALGLRQAIPARIRKAVYARLIGRSPTSWNRVFLIDKGARQGIRLNMLVLSEMSLIGKIVEVGPSVSKVLLITDPNSRIGALLQRTRQSGVLYGSASGECRLKYLSLEEEAKAGDVVETAGFGGFFPKGLLIGEIVNVRKEPGQIYQVARVRPFANLNKVEEVVCVE